MTKEMTFGDRVFIRAYANMALAASDPDVTPGDILVSFTETIQDFQDDFILTPADAEALVRAAARKSRGYQEQRDAQNG